jgi:hypothetical protein
MATAAVSNIVKQIKKLFQSEQQELRAALDSLFSSATSLTEEKFHQ